MPAIRALFENNRRWAERKTRVDPGFFKRLAAQQSPEYLWIGCSDSRVPATDIVDVDPGTIFVHRNVANLVVASDINFLSVLQYSVEVLRVKHIIVCGHYGCGGVQAALQGLQFGIIDNWLQPIKELAAEHAEELRHCATPEWRVDRLCELNVARQAVNVAKTSIIQNAWHRGDRLEVHGWIYSLADGLLRDLEITIRGLDDLPPAFRLLPLEVR